MQADAARRWGPVGGWERAVRVLVVDDDQTARYLAASIVRSAGHDVVTANDGAEALATARADVPDVLLSDILMPRMDGYQLAREWKADPLLAAVPIVFLTASYTDAADERFALDLGAERFLTKPVEPDVLIEVLAEIAEGAGREMRGRAPRIGEQEILREYSERLVRKLEHKVIELQQANELLTSAMNALSEELEVKTALIGELGGQIDGRDREMASLRAHDELGTAIDGALALAVVADVNGTVRYFGKGAERLTGYSAGEVVGRDWFDMMVPAEERDARRSAMASLLAAGGSDCSSSVIMTARGDRLDVVWTDHIWRNDNGDVAGVVTFGALAE